MDRCDNDHDVAATYLVCTPRPSDPTEIVCILAFCERCAREQGEVGKIVNGRGIATRKQWGEWFEKFGKREGFLWLSI